MFAERTPDEKLAYIQGLEIGARQVFALVGKHSVEDAQRAWDIMLPTVKATIDNAPPDSLPRPETPSPMTSQS